ncbi:hypothetical protein FTUN_7237 [Frigoriglobus tundricola]|uniref:Uncharacterized protein n=1 Tax=Frigoriglobus tundricola TaxID=2774151 RepID=A0A6M5YZX9_9BACT|nr:hypothetical protein FTUN_7237 [Frigoriglobus tundricola]
MHEIEPLKLKPHSGLPLTHGPFAAIIFSFASYRGSL